MPTLEITPVACWKVGSSTLGIFLSHVELLLPLLETRQNNTTNVKQRKGEKQFLIGPRARGRL
jgi:hypothetical protein